MTERKGGEGTQGEMIFIERQQREEKGMTRKKESERKQKGGK